LCPTPEQAESAALKAARERILELENEVKILRKAAAAVEEVVHPKARFVLVAELADEGVPVKQACVVLGVSRSGFCDSRGRRPRRGRSARRG
jgi:putative transposase